MEDVNIFAVDWAKIEHLQVLAANQFNEVVLVA